LVPGKPLITKHLSHFAVPRVALKSSNVVSPFMAMGPTAN
jgi:hypothetical protein